MTLPLYEPPTIREVDQPDMIPGEHAYCAACECGPCRNESERLLRAIFGEPDPSEADPEQRADPVECE